jgi:hypothetical protein
MEHGVEEEKVHILGLKWILMIYLYLVRALLPYIRVRAYALNVDKL